MIPFNTFTAPVAHLPLVNVDTDMIIPKQFLKTLLRTGLGKFLFFDMRYHDDGSEKADFILNDLHYKNGCILLTGENFGCGSSREHAPWALSDYGIRSIIAPSFADIFYNNCFKNGMLPIVLQHDEIHDFADVLSSSTDDSVEIDLEQQRIRVCAVEQKEWIFSIEASLKKALLEGLDDIAVTLLESPEITAYEENTQRNLPWLFA